MRDEMVDFSKFGHIYSEITLNFIPDFPGVL